VWRIAAHGEDVVYAVDFNHRKEHHLNGAAIDGIVSRPAILITGASHVACSTIRNTVSALPCTAHKRNNFLNVPKWCHAGQRVLQTVLVLSAANSVKALSAGAVPVGRAGHAPCL